MQTSFRNWQDRDYEVTALVSTYRSAEFMAECLSDLEGQTIARRPGGLEIIVVDAASPENEGEIVRDFQERHDNIRYYRTPERIGVYPAWNLAIREARGEFLTTQNTNDRLFPRAHAVMAAALRADPEAVLVFGNYHATELPHQPLEGFVESEAYAGAYVWDNFSYKQLLSVCMVGPCPLWRRGVHAEFGYFDEKYVALGDQDFWLRLGRRRKLLHIRDYVGLIWVTPGSLSGSDIARAEEAEIHKKHQELFVKEQSPLVDAFLADLEGFLAAGREAQALALYDRIRPSLDWMKLDDVDKLMALVRARLGG